MSILTPSQLYEKYPGEFYRLTNEGECHRGVTYTTGLNIDPLPFNPIGECNAGGMYFFHESQINLNNIYDARSVKWLRKVTFPEDALIYAEDGKFKTDKFILGEREVIPTWVYMRSVSIDGFTLRFVVEEMKTYEMCLEAVKNDWYSLQYVPVKMREEMRFEAMKHYSNSGVTLKYVP